MKKQTLAIISIIAIGSLTSIVSATSTSISDSGITTPALTTNTLTVTGSCSGCGGGSGSFTLYSTVLNQTISGTDGSTPILILINDTGSIIAETNFQTEISLNSNGNKIFVFNQPQTTLGTPFNPMMVQSLDGRYIAVINQTNNDIYVWKDHQLLQTIGINISQWCPTGGVLSNGRQAIAISPNAKFIGLFGEDSSCSIQRIITLEGT